MFAIVVVAAIGVLIARSRPTWALPLIAFCTFASGLDFHGFGVWYLDGMVRLDIALIYGLGLAGLWRGLSASRRVPKSLQLLFVWTLMALIISAVRQGSLLPSGWVPWSFMLAALLFGATYTEVRSMRSIVLTMWVAILASSIAVGYQLWVREPFSRLDIEGVATSGRMFSFSATLIIGLAVVAQIAGVRASRFRSVNIITCMILVLALVSLQQRTAWLATAVGVVSVLWYKRANLARYLMSANLRKIKRSIVVVVCLGAGLGIILAVSHAISSGDDAGTREPQSSSVAEPSKPAATDATLGFSSSFTDDRNLEWRVAVWRQFADRQNSPTAWLLGEDLSERPGPQWSPHSQYVETLRRVGLVGLVMLALVVIQAWSRRRRIAPSLGGVIVPVSIVAGLTYEWSAFLAVLLGACLIPTPKRSGPENSNYGTELSTETGHKRRSLFIRQNPPTSNRQGLPAKETGD